MSKTDDLENGILLLLFNNTTFATLGDATGALGSATVGALYVSLHTAEPITNDQSQFEVVYGNYARVELPRTSAKWAVTGSSVSPVNDIVFPKGSSGNDNATHFGIGTALTSTGSLLYTGAITPTIHCADGVTPTLTNAMIVTED